ncbi:hypothetical protein RA989_21770, partial [Mycobacteroides abscessus subsp. massiliense]
VHMAELAENALHGVVDGGVIGEVAGERVRTADRMARVTMMKTPAGIIMSGPSFGINETDVGAEFVSVFGRL